jgi:hypothetical protein
MRRASAHLRLSLISDRALLDLFTRGCIDHFEAEQDDVTRAHRGVLLDRIECCKIDCLQNICRLLAQIRCVQEEDDHTQSPIQVVVINQQRLRNRCTCEMYCKTENVIFRP